MRAPDAYEVCPVNASRAIRRIWLGLCGDGQPVSSSPIGLWLGLCLYCHEPSNPPGSKAKTFSVPCGPFDWNHLMPSLLHMRVRFRVVGVTASWDHITARWREQRQPGVVSNKFWAIGSRSSVVLRIPLHSAFGVMKGLPKLCPAARQGGCSASVGSGRRDRDAMSATPRELVFLFNCDLQYLQQVRAKNSRDLCHLWSCKW